MLTLELYYCHSKTIFIILHNGLAIRIEGFRIILLSL